MLQMQLYCIITVVKIDEVIVMGMNEDKLLESFNTIYTVGFYNLPAVHTSHLRLSLSLHAQTMFTIRPSKTA